MNNFTKKILSVFEEINRIPRGSGNMIRIHDYFRAWAEKNSFSFKTDKALNICINVPGTKNYMKSDIIVLQAHMDMVCEKTKKSNHDFFKDPIIHLIDGDWLTADNTSLGADNGIALAITMVIATDSSIEHPPLELLFTTDEEVGMCGADEIKKGFINGRKMINLDAQEAGVFVIGCAGSTRTHIDFILEKEVTGRNDKSLKLSVSGFSGGHSGDDISKPRGNANTELIRGLNELSRLVDFRISSIKGGSAINAISRSAEADIVVHKNNIKNVKSFWNSFSETITSENKAEGKKCIAECCSIVNSAICFNLSSSRDFVKKLRIIPHGVQHMNPLDNKQVETSINFAIIGMTESGIRISTMQRSSVNSRLMELTDRIRNVADLFSGEFILENISEPWEPDYDSSLIKTAVSIWEKKSKNSSDIKITHVGLECGIIKNLYNGMKIIAMGPDIENLHSPDERVRISSVELFFGFFMEFLLHI